MLRIYLFVINVSHACSIRNEKRLLEIPSNIIDKFVQAFLNILMILSNISDQNKK